MRAYVQYVQVPMYQPIFLWQYISTAVRKILTKELSWLSIHTKLSGLRGSWSTESCYLLSRIGQALRLVGQALLWSATEGLTGPVSSDKDRKQIQDILQKYAWESVSTSLSTPEECPQRI